MLTLDQQVNVFRESFRAFRLSFFPDHSPGRVDDFFLQFRQLLGLLSILALLLLLLLLSTRWRLSFSKDLVKGSHFGEEHVAFDASRLPIGTDIFGPKVIGKQLIRFRPEIFESKKMPNRFFCATRQRLAEQHILGRLRVKGIRQTVFRDTKVIAEFRPQFHFLEWRNGNVTAHGQLQRRWLIRKDPRDQLGRILVLASRVVDKFQL